AAHPLEGEPPAARIPSRSAESSRNHFRDRGSSPLPAARIPRRVSRTRALPAPGRQGAAEERPGERGEEEERRKRRKDEPADHDDREGTLQLRSRAEREGEREK